MNIPDNLLKEIFDETNLLTASYMQMGYGLSGLIGTNPSEMWETIKWNPWAAMAVFHDMEEKDDVIASSLDTRKDGVLAKSRNVLPASDKRQDRKIADFVEETLEGYFDAKEGKHTGLDQVLYECLDGVGKGVSIGEILYGATGDRLYVKDVKYKPQHLFAFGETALAPYSTASYMLPQSGPLRLRAGMMIDGVGFDGKLPEYKFLVGSYKPQYSNRWGTPTDRKIFWPSWFKRAGMKQYLRFCEKGSGSVVSRYHDGAAPDEQNKALLAALAISQESAAALPAKFPIEVLQHVRQAMGSAYIELIDDLCNNAIMRVILGQTLTSRGSEGGGSRSLGDIHNQVRGEKIESDAKFLMRVINTGIVWPLVLFNFGPVHRPPVWVINYEAQRDLSAFSTWLARLWTLRLPIPKKFVYETFQIPEPTEGEEVLVKSEAEPDEDPDIPGTGVDPSVDFVEKKTSNNKGSVKRSQSKTQRFRKLRPSTMKS